MNQTENISDLVSALSKAQGEMQPAVFNKSNSHFKQKYADFTSCMDACRVPLSKNGLAVMQYCDTINDKLVLVTMLAHASGQYIKSFMPIVTTKMDSQGIGSAMTYCKRYGLSAMLGIVSDEDRELDDDGETAVGRGKESKPTIFAPKPSKEEKPEPIKLVDPNKAHELMRLRSMLTDGDREILDGWIVKTYEINTLDNLPESAFEKILHMLNKKAKNENPKP